MSNLSREVVPPLVRITSGVLLGMGALGLLAAAVAARDAGMAWVVLDVALLAVAAVTVLTGLATLREMHARSTFIRGWAWLGAVILLILTLFISLD